MLGLQKRGFENDMLATPAFARVCGRHECDIEAFESLWPLCCKACAVGNVLGQVHYP
jgi:hypothetical protein